MFFLIYFVIIFVVFVFFLNFILIIKFKFEMDFIFGNVVNVFCNFLFLCLILVKNVLLIFVSIVFVFV